MRSRLSGRRAHRGIADLTRPFESLADGLTRSDTAAREGSASSRNASADRTLERFPGRRFIGYSPATARSESEATWRRHMTTITPAVVAMNTHGLTNHPR